MPTEVLQDPGHLLGVLRHDLHFALSDTCLDSSGISTNRFTTGVDYNNIIDYTPQKNRSGTSVQQGMRSLAKHNPDLLDDVVEGKVSVNKAMIDSGKRKRKVQVVPEDPEQVARILKKHMSECIIENPVKSRVHHVHHALSILRMLPMNRPT